MKSGERRGWRPLSELTLLVAAIMAIRALVSIQTTVGRWTMIGAVVLGLLAGLEIRSRAR